MFSFSYVLAKFFRSCIRPVHRQKAPVQVEGISLNVFKVVHKVIPNLHKNLRCCQKIHVFLVWLFTSHDIEQKVHGTIVE